MPSSETEAQDPNVQRIVDEFVSACDDIDLRLRTLRADLVRAFPHAGNASSAVAQGAPVSAAGTTSEPVAQAHAPQPGPLSAPGLGEPVTRAPFREPASSLFALSSAEAASPSSMPLSAGIPPDLFRAYRAYAGYGARVTAAGAPVDTIGLRAGTPANPPGVMAAPLGTLPLQAASGEALGAMGAGERIRSPVTDVVETAQEFRIICEVPGVRQEDVVVRPGAIPGTLVVEVPVKGPAHENRVLKSERGFDATGSSVLYRKIVPLGSLAAVARAQSALAEGVLTIRVPKLEPSES
ncbi:MAG: Hsp20/alpha crystallin family protein [Thermoplasmatota archaeon]